MASLLPEGALPKYILLVGVLAVYNAVQCYVPSMRLTHRIYAKQPAQGKQTNFPSATNQIKLQTKLKLLISSLTINVKNDGNMDSDIRLNPNLRRLQSQ